MALIALFFMLWLLNADEEENKAPQLLESPTLQLLEGRRIRTTHRLFFSSSFVWVLDFICCLVVMSAVRERINIRTHDAVLWLSAFLNN